MHITQRIACKAVIHHQGKILILREAAYADGTQTGRYHLPGGRINPGEAFQAGLQREISEETGLTIEIGPPLYVGEWFPTIQGASHQIVAIFFACTTTDPTVTLSEEHDDARWIDPAQHVEYDIMDPEPQVIQTYIQFSPN